MMWMNIEKDYPEFILTEHDVILHKDDYMLFNVKEDTGEEILTCHYKGYIDTDGEITLADKVIMKADNYQELLRLIKNDEMSKGEA